MDPEDLRIDRVPLHALTVVRTAFNKFPGLELTEQQVSRLFNLQPEACSLVLADLHEAGYLCRDGDGHYSKA